MPSGDETRSGPSRHAPLDVAQLPVLRQAVQRDQHGQVLLERLQAGRQVQAGEEVSRRADSYPAHRKEKE